MNKAIILFGYTGLIGNKIYQYFSQKNEYEKIFCFTRKNLKSNHNKTILIQYSLENLEQKLQEIITNNPNYKWIILIFTGESIFGIINSQKWKQIYDSRITINNKIISVIQKTSPEIEKIFSASAIGIYYQSPNHQVNEYSQIRENILTNLIQKWENTILNSELSQNSIVMRLGAVIDKKSKIYQSLIIPALFSIGVNFVPTPSFPWIHNNEIPEIVDFLLQKNQQGVFNIVNPKQLTYKEFIENFVKNNSILKKTLIINISKETLKRVLSALMPKFYEVTYSLFCSPKVLPQRLIELGYNFKYNDPFNLFR